MVRKHGIIFFTSHLLLICFLELKEEAEMGSRSRHGSGASSTGERVDPPDLPPTMGQTLDVILKRLKEKRKEAHRPEDIEVYIHFFMLGTNSFSLVMPLSMH